jgi:hypothetical protein
VFECPRGAADDERMGLALALPDDNDANDGVRANEGESVVIEGRPDGDRVDRATEGGCDIDVRGVTDGVAGDDVANELVT